MVHLGCFYVFCNWRFLRVCICLMLCAYSACMCQLKKFSPDFVAVRDSGLIPTKTRICSNANYNDQLTSNSHGAFKMVSSYLHCCVRLFFVLWFTRASTEWRRRIWQMSFFQPADLTMKTTNFVRHRHCSFAVHGCRLSATERFRSLLPIFGTVCRVMSPPLHRCLSIVAAWKVTFSSSPFRDLYSCSVCAVTRSFHTL